MSKISEPRESSLSRNNGESEHPARPTGETERIETASSNPVRKALIGIILLAILVGGSIAGYHFWCYAATHMSTDDAQLDSDVVQIAPQVSGTVEKVLVKENQLVKAGTKLVVLDDSTYRTAVEQAQANLDAAIAQAQGAGIAVTLTNETGGAQMLQAQGVVDQAESGIASAKSDASRAEAAMSTAKANAASAESGIAAAKSDVSRADAAVSTAKANAASAEANISNTLAVLEAAKVSRKRAQDGVRSAEAQITTAQANALAGLAGVDAAQAIADKAAHDAQRYADLHEKGAVSAQVAEQASATARTTKAQLESARRQVDAANALVTARQADLESARRQIETADATIAQANAQIATAHAQAAAAQANIKQTIAQYHSAQQNVLQAHAQAAAAQANIKQTIAQYHSAQQNVLQAQARREQAMGQMKQAHTTPHQVDVSRSSHAQALAKIAQARAALRAAQIQLKDTVITAPCDGLVSNKSVQVGALVQPGTPLLAIIQQGPSDQPWVVANFKETQITKMHNGDQVEIEVDCLPGHKFTGKVDSLAGATGAKFALLPPDNATGNFTKVVQRVPVKIVLDVDQPDIDKLKAGLSVKATVVVR